MNPYDEILKTQEIQHAPKLLKQHGLICKQMPLGDGAPLYVAKAHWTNRFEDDRESTIGVFCAIWVGPSLLKKKQFAYNIHAKTLAKLPGYTLVPKKFASDFRGLVQASVASWPGIRLDYGPSTLLQGKQTCDLDDFAEKAAERLSGFADIHQYVDDLLEAAKT